MIRILKPAEIELEKYEQLIKRYAPDCPYFQPWYLEAVTDGEWRLMVYKEYEAALPFPIARIGPFRHIPHRFYLQKLGFLGGSIDAEELMLHKWKAHYPYGYYAFHFPPKAILKPLRKRKNYVLALTAEYLSLRQHYSEQHLRKVKHREKFTFERLHAEAEIESLLQQLANDERHPLSSKNGQRRKRLMRAALQHRAMYFQKGTDNNGALAYNWWILTGKQGTYLGGGENEAGQALQLKTCGIDAFIEEFSGKDFLLDFEGSDVSGIARYYEGFGAEATFYSAWERFPIWYQYWRKRKKV
jgi:hypothetical protein